MQPSPALRPVVFGCAAGDPRVTEAANRPCSNCPETRPSTSERASPSSRQPSLHPPHVLHRRPPSPPPASSSAPSYPSAPALFEDVHLVITGERLPLPQSRLPQVLAAKSRCCLTKQNQTDRTKRASPAYATLHCIGLVVDSSPRFPRWPASTEDRYVPRHHPRPNNHPPPPPSWVAE